ncbi:MAG: CHAT domain-containing protein, partial [Rhodocyclales bacterium]|nr:CHAT domain-containing protein [Rhodocyclales bacterium]
GMLNEAEEALRRASDGLPEVKLRRDWVTEQYNVMDNFSRYSAWLQELRGNKVEAERFRRAALDNARQYLPLMLRSLGADSQIVQIAKQNVTSTTRQLAGNLSSQGKMGEAEHLANEAVNQTLSYLSFNTVGASNALSVLGTMKLQQGKVVEAARYAELATQALERSEVKPYSTALAARRSQMGFILVVQGRWKDALKVFETRDQGLRSSSTQFDKTGSRNIDWAMALLKTGQGTKSAEMMQSLLDSNLKRSFVDPVYIAHLRGYLGVALTQLGDSDQALAQFQRAMPALLKQAHDGAGDEDSAFVRVYRMNVILEAYLELLAKLQAEGKQIVGLDIVAEAFKLADIARNSSVQRAVTASAARATLPDPQLAQLARREQDATNQMQALNKILTRLASAPEGRRLQAVMNNMQRDIDTLAREQVALRKELAEKFPDYANLVAPQPATPADIQRTLLPDEVVIAIFSGERQSYVWTITKSDVGYRTVPVAREQLARDVAQLLRSVNLSDGQIRDFDTATAYRLYATLLAPDAAMRSNAKLINVIPHGALGQLPFATLLTEPIAQTAGRSVPTYAEMPWMLHKAAIAQQSSASGFMALRRSVPTKIERMPFIGFGDPLFIADAAPGTQRGKRFRNLAIAATNDETLSMVEQAQQSQVPSGNAGTTNRPTLAQAFSMLPALPDTSEELRDIARTTGADQEKDVFLGVRATEANIKAADLSRYRVVAFATHGLVPGEISGLDQPALAMGNPALTKDTENDGFLTLEEVLGLKLNAEWVVLSACNTGSTDGNASEAVSGLGRAFFYAGTRSLLVSSWAVETVSARLLTTGLFQQQASHPAMSRAEALRQSMLAVMKSTTDDYSHPAFWAPFSLVGDGLVQ